ncbi:MAG TPA: CAP domain-containing protein [Methyloceanibacter sp.]|nr:CAP domain-containing protein [Methyloceanibacter sp.]
MLAQRCAGADVSTPVEYRISAFNAQAALAEINAFRRQHGLKPVVLDARLSKAASKQANDQARRGKIGHEGADGSKRPCSARSGQATTPTSRQRTWPLSKDPSVRRCKGWERSPEHKRNLLLPDAEAVGVAVSYRNGRAYYTLVLGAE